MELKRTVDQWENCDPESMAYHMSQAAIMYAFKDARHDILRMHDEITRLRAELAKVTWQRNEAQADLAASRAESERLSSMIDHQRDEAVEMERMLRAELADSQSECERMTELCRRLYVELFHCDKQMTNTRGEEGEPLWTTGKTVLDVLQDAKKALDAALAGEVKP